jgi:hypothetical protein
VEILDEVSLLSDEEANAVESAVTEFEGASSRLSALLRPLTDAPQDPALS